MGLPLLNISHKQNHNMWPFVSAFFPPGIMFSRPTHVGACTSTSVIFRAEYFYYMGIRHFIQPFVRWWQMQKISIWRLLWIYVLNVSQFSICSQSWELDAEVDKQPCIHSPQGDYRVPHPTSYETLTQERPSSLRSLEKTVRKSHNVTIKGLPLNNWEL